MKDLQKLLQEAIQAYSEMIKSTKGDKKFLKENPLRVPRQTGTLFGLSKGLELRNTKEIDREIMSIKDAVLSGKDQYKVGYGVGLIMVMSIMRGDDDALKDLDMLIDAVKHILPAKK